MKHLYKILSRRRKMNRKYSLHLFFGLVILFLTLFVGFKNQQSADETSSPPQNVTVFIPEKSQVSINTDKEVLHYKRVSFYNENDFSEIVKSHEVFSSNIIETFKKDLQRHNIEALNCTHELNTVDNSTIVHCDIKGAMYRINSYDFHWLLGDLPFDLYQFTQNERELTYKGTINDIPTTIRLIFQFPIAHCHEHVWPAR